MNTVPSGSVDFCIKGAACVSGTPTLGIPTPAIVGRPVRWKAERVLVAEPFSVSVDSSDEVSDEEVSDAAGAFVTLKEDNVGDGLPVVVTLSVFEADVSSLSVFLSVVLVAAAVVVASSVLAPSVWVIVSRSGRSVGLLP
jgi:hypothetical protein